MLQSLAIHFITNSLPPVLTAPPTSTGAATTSLHFSAAFSRTGHQHISQRNSPYTVKDLWHLSTRTWKARIVLSRSWYSNLSLGMDVFLIEGMQLLSPASTATEFDRRRDSFLQKISWIRKSLSSGKVTKRFINGQRGRRRRRQQKWL
ncbi:hypothetical protein SLA2020_311010 [Shorea laevis]